MKAGDSCDVCDAVYFDSVHLNPGNLVVTHAPMCDEVRELQEKVAWLEGVVEGMSERIDAIPGAPIK